MATCPYMNFYLTLASLHNTADKNPTTILITLSDNALPYCFASRHHCWKSWFCGGLPPQPALAGWYRFVRRAGAQVRGWR